MQTVTKHFYEWQYRHKRNKKWRLGERFQSKVTAKDAREQRAAYPDMRYREIKVTERITIRRRNTGA